MTSDRDELRQKGAALRWRVAGGAPPAPGAPALARAVGFDRLVDEACYGAVWSRGHLSEGERMLATLAALACAQRLPQLKRAVGGALDIGLAPRAILEVFVHCGLYGGFPLAENAIEAADEVFADRGTTVPDDAPDTATLDELTARGHEAMADLHGERSTQGYADPGNEVTGRLYGMAIQYGYGVWWFRGGLERRERMICALAAFAVLRLDATLRKFCVSALNLGLSRDEVIEAVIQTAPYHGFPPTLVALSIVAEVYAA